MSSKATALTSIKPELDLAIIEDLKAKGYSQSEIADMFGVTRQAVSWHKRTYSGSLSPRERVLQNFPWHVSSVQGQCSAYRRLRDHGEYVATGGVGMSQDKLKRLRAFYRQVRKDNVVLEYDPDLPPQPGFAIKGGFMFRLRHEQDGDLLIRVNQHTNLTDEGQLIWRLPVVDP